MKYFSKVKTEAEAQQQYRTLVLLHHPDCGGDTATMQEINAEWIAFKAIYKVKDAVEHSEFYTPYGWKGKNYNSKLSCKEIAKITRCYVSEKYSDYRFSVTADYNSIKVMITESPVDVWYILGDENFYNPLNVDFRERKNSEQRGEVSYYLPNSNKILFVPAVAAVLDDIYMFVQSYNFDDSDAMRDYFHTNFYFTLAVGKWDKPIKTVFRKKKPSKFLEVA